MTCALAWPSFRPASSPVTNGNEPSNDRHLLAALVAACGDFFVYTGTDGDTFGRDERGVFAGPVIAGVRPATTEAVAAVVRACAAAGVAVVTQGGNTGLSGGAQPIADQPAVVVSLGRMRTIEAIDVDGSTAVVQAGVTIEAIQQAAAAAGRLFAPDWGARGTASIGGAISTNAGGINVLQFGPTRDHVLGLEVVLADGRIWNGMTALRKDSTGYQLRQFFVGAEGTLGIITKAVVRLLPAIHDHQTALIAMDDVDRALSLLAIAREAGGTVTACELLPEMGVARALERFNIERPLPTIRPWYLLVRIATPKGLDAADAMVAFLQAGNEAGGIVDAVVAGTPDQEETLWLIRDEMPPTNLWDNIDGYIKYDTAVPLARVTEFIQRAEALTAEISPAWTTFSFGHIGDGNIHLHVLPAFDQPWNPADRTAIKAAINSLTFELGGSLSAEHGVGQALRAEMLRQKEPIEIELAWRIKHAFDPDGVLNPGKTLPVLHPR